MEDLLIKKIENAIRSIKLGALDPKDAKVGYFLNKLKPLNPYMYQDLLNNYKTITK